MKTISELEDFLNTDLPQVLKTINGSEQALWGSMNLQQMIEHITLAFGLARGLRSIELTAPESNLIRMKNIGLLSDRPMPKGFNNPILTDDLKKLRHTDSENAIQHLLDEIKQFTAYYKSMPSNHTMPHNIFGQLNYHEWLWFNYKHILHHLAQFGLVAYQDRIQ
ncbi:MAG: DinB family protein [Bacteroidota bacterium]|jgi:hydroxymethylglutaryl-CoA reductase